MLFTSIFKALDLLFTKLLDINDRKINIMTNLKLILMEKFTKYEIFDIELFVNKDSVEFH